jgi:GT2 family glycosyltransferase
LKIAIVILNWNGEKLLEQFLPSVIAYSKLADIYLADNASTDNSIEFTKSKYPEIHIIQNKTNGGYAKGYNDALQYVKADLFCLLNSDVEVTKNWLEPIIHVFKNSKAAIVQPKILDYKNKEYFEYAGAAGGFIDAFGYPYCRGRIFNTIEKDNGQYNDIKEIFWASGACMFIKKQVFEELGGFDEDYFAHQEEIDLCWRAKNNGHQIFYVGTSTIYHVGGATISNLSPKKAFFNFRNSLFSLIKNLPKHKIISIVLSRLFLDAIAGFKFILEFKLAFFLAIIKAHFSFYYYFLKILKKRPKKVLNIKYYLITSVVWTYFVDNKKHYHDL